MDLKEAKHMKEISVKELTERIRSRDKSLMLDLSELHIANADLAGWDLSNIDFHGCDFENTDVSGADFDRCNLHKCWFKDCKMQNLKLTNADVTECNMRWMDLSGSDFSGSNFHRALFEYSTLENITDDENTQFYRMVCPEEGPFIAWKCCTDLRVVMLLVPADAKRVSATGETCRCSKAKVLSIKSIDESQSYTWAQSTVDPDFYYEVGKWVEPANRFEEDRWMDSSPGIHFFMERQQCVDYQSK